MSSLIKQKINTFSKVAMQDGLLSASVLAFLDYKRKVVERYYSYKYHRNSSESVNLCNGKEMLLNSNDAGFSIDIILGDGIREPLATRYFLDEYNDCGGEFVDLGANIGYYTLLLSDKFDTVSAVEPIEENLKLLVKNVRKNDLDNVEIVEKAVVPDNREEITLKVADEKNFCRPSEDGVQVEAINFAELMREPELLRIDIEGYEKELFMENKKELRENGPERIFIEIHLGMWNREEAKEFLRTLDYAGYKVERVFKEMRNPIEWRNNLLRKLHFGAVSLSNFDPIIYQDCSLEKVLKDEKEIVFGFCTEFVLRKEL